MFKTLALFTFIFTGHALGAEPVCLWSNEKAAKPKLCKLGQISPASIAQIKTEKSLTKLVPSEKGYIRFGLLSFVKTSPEKFLSLLNDHKTIQRLVENIKELSPLHIESLEELAKYSRTYVQNNPDIDFAKSSFTKSKIFYGKKQPLGVMVNRINHTFDYQDEDNNLNSLISLVKADKYFETSILLWNLIPYEGGTIIQLYSEDKVNSLPGFVLNLVQKEAPEETVRLINNLKREATLRN